MGLEFKKKFTQLQTLFEIINKSPVCAYSINVSEEVHVEYISKNIIKYGYSAKEIMAGKVKFFDLIHQTDFSQKNIKEYYSFNENITTNSRQFKIRGKAGKSFWIEEIAKAIFNKEGKLTHIHGIIIDISEQKNTEEEKIQVQTQIQHASKLASLGTLAGNIAHELCTPLTIINNLTACTKESIMNGGSDKENLLLLEKISDTNNKTLNLAKQLRSFVHVNKGKVEEVDVNKLIQETVNLFACFIGNKRVKISFAPCLDVLKITADSNQLQQVVYNFLINAHDALEKTKHKPLIYLSTSCRLGYCEIVFSDNGCGINHEHMDKIFEPYFSTKPKDRGTGLGLSISYSIIKSFGGTIKVQSTVDVGTKFIVKFPLFNQKNIQISKALIFDSVKVSCNIISWIANEIGLPNDWVNTYENARNKMACCDYQFIIVDLSTINCSNLLLLKDIRRLASPKTTIIAISAHAFSSFGAEEQKIIRDQTSSFIRKPLCKESLFNALGSTFSTRESFQL